MAAVPLVILIGYGTGMPAFRSAAGAVAYAGPLSFASDSPGLAVFDGVLLLLFFLDAFMILMHLMPAQGFGEEWHIFAMLFTAYFSLMALAIFPGRPYEGVERGRE